MKAVLSGGFQAIKGRLEREEGLLENVLVE